MTRANDPAGGPLPAVQGRKKRSGLSKSPDVRRRQLEGLGKGRAIQQRYPGQGRLMKVDVLLSDAEREEYAALLRNPRTTIPSLRQWLADRGHDVGTNGIGKHRARFVARLRQVRDAAELSRMLLKVAREDGDRLDPADAAAAYAEQQLLRTLFNVLGAQESGTFDAAAWEGVFKVLGLSAKSREAIERLRGPAKSPRKPGDPPPTPGDRAAALTGLALRVREALGVPPPAAAGGRGGEPASPDGDGPHRRPSAGATADAPEPVPPDADGG